MAVLLSADSSAQMEWTPQSVVTFIELETPTLFPNDLGLLDVLVGGPTTRLRFYRTTNGLEDPATLAPGQLLSLDIDAPIAALDPFNGLDGIGWPPGPPTQWVENAPVSFWNDVLDPLQDGKGNSQQGLTSRNGMLYVNSRQKSAASSTGPAWNGLSRVSGASTPSTAFTGAAKELYSSTLPHDRAGPEGSVVFTSSTGETFHVTTNFSGQDAAGWLHVQDTTSTATTSADSITFDVYALLGAFVDSGQYVGKFGWEVPKVWFHTPTAPHPGEKLRGAHVVRVPGIAGSFPNAGRLLLFIGVNLDPVWPPLFELAAPGFDPAIHYTAMDGSSYLSSPAGSADDGKYDYIAVIDVTDLSTVPTGSGWYYRDVGQWILRTKFIPLPPDFPDVIDCDNPQGKFAPGLPSCATNLCLGFFGNAEGYDWSCVSEQVTDSQLAIVQIVGSGTIAGITSHPTGSFVYVTTTDEDVDRYYAQPPETFNDRDGGWHVPHIYAIDLSQADFTDQQSILASTTLIRSARFNFRPVKLQDMTGGVFSWLPIWKPGDQSTQGWAESIPDLPIAKGNGYVSQGQVPTILDVSISGENYFVPTARARPIAVRNRNLEVDKTRLYIAANGWMMQAAYPANLVPGDVILPAAPAGVVYSFKLPEGHNSFGQAPTIDPLPFFRKKYLLPFKDLGADRTFVTGGMAALPTTDEYLLFESGGATVDNSNKRNVIAVFGEDTVSVPNPPAAEHRLFLIQDT